MKLRYVSAVATLAVLLPFAASALTADDLQQQIQSLLSQISQLQQQLKQLTTTNPTQIACTMEAKICPDGTAVGRTGANCEFAACPGTGVKSLPPICPIFNRTLAQGATGDDVTQLQQYLGVSPTGYFGTATAQAVTAVQADAGISQVGIVGPATRAWFYKRCGGGGWNQNFSASPTSGTAPLTVGFTASNLDKASWSTPGSYSVEFGDGTSGQMSGNALCLECNNGYGNGYSVSASHTYTSNGTYTAKLIYQPSFSCPPGAMCPAMMPMPRTIGTVTIYVGGTSTSGAPSISGLDGPAALNVGQTGTWTVHASVANSGNTNLRYSVIWGDEGVIGQLNAFAGNVPSAIWTSGSFTHAYANAGAYRPTFTVANDAGSAQTSASLVVGDTGGMCTGAYPLCPVGTHNGGRCNQDCIPDNTSGTFSASPTSGQAPLAVHFWATVSGGEYKVDFGDGTSGGLSGGWCPPNPAMGAPCSAPGADHTYTSAGTYTARLLQRSTCAIDTTCWVPVLGASTVTITVVTGSWTDNCLSVYGCSYPVPPSQYPNATVVVGQTSSGSTPVAGTGGSCVYNGQTYPNGALMSSSGTACSNPMGCGISSTYLVCQDGRAVVSISPPNSGIWR
ncbi:MAG: peptidoglycan-binding protein [Patescibacteria group bacterium]